MIYQGPQDKISTPPRGYDPSQQSNVSNNKLLIESKGSSITEDFRRTALLERYIKTDTNKYKKQANKLIEKLNKNAPSLASSSHMRKIRRCVSGYLWKIVDETGVDDVSFVTVIPKHWEISGDELHKKKPRQLLNAFRSTLNRCGLNTATGWMFLYIHGEYEPKSNIFSIHLHGLASGEMINLFDELRKKPNYRSIKDQQNEDISVVQRVKITREPLTNLPAPITYTMQSFWPSRARYTINNNDLKRQTKKRRIPEPYHSYYLLWLDRWVFDDMKLMVGLRYTKSGLAISNRKTNIDEGLKL